MPPQIPNPPSSPKKISPPIFIWILLIVSGLVGSFQIYQFLTPLDAKSNFLINRNTSTVDWKTYSNTTYGFEFKYPSNFIEKKGGDDEYGFRAPEGGSIVFEIQDIRFDQNNIKDDLGKPVVGKQVTYNDQVWYKYDLDLELCYGPEYYTALGNRTFILKFRECIQHKGLDVSKETFSPQVLSTFKLITATSTKIDISNWKTYTDKKGKFTFKYPDDWKGYDDLLSLDKLYKSPDIFCQLHVFADSDITYAGEEAKSIVSNLLAGNSVTNLPNAFELIEADSKPALVENSKFVTNIYVPTERDKFLEIGLISGTDPLNRCKNVQREIVSTFKFTK